MEAIVTGAATLEFLQVSRDQQGTVTLTLDLATDPIEAKCRLEKIIALDRGNTPICLLEVDGPTTLPWGKYTTALIELLLVTKVNRLAVPEAKLLGIRGRVGSLVMESLHGIQALTRRDVPLRDVISTSPLTSRILALTPGGSEQLDERVKSAAKVLASFQERKFVPPSLRRLICNLSKVVKRNTRADKISNTRIKPSQPHPASKSQAGAGGETVLSDSDESGSVTDEDLVELDVGQKAVQKNMFPFGRAESPAVVNYRFAQGDDQTRPGDDKPQQDNAPHINASTNLSDSLPSPRVGCSKYDLQQTHAPLTHKCYVCMTRTPVVQAKTGPLKQYTRMCLKCAKHNLEMRNMTADLTGYYAVITGGRVKIGYETVLKLLRAGCHVITTTRFPHDATKRYSAEIDYKDWFHRLKIYPLELKDAKGIYKFIEYLKVTIPHLDILINNAAQTLHRPYSFHEHLLEYEKIPHKALPTQQAELLPASAPLLTYTDMASGLVTNMLGCATAAIGPAKGQTYSRKRWHPSSDIAVDSKSKKTRLRVNDVDESLAKHVSDTDFPAGCLDEFGQQLDLRRTNSWRSVLEEVPVDELLEVMVVNTIAPYILSKELKGLMLASPHRRRFIVNVSAMEGQFNRASKTRYHPHTNMAKAALNMMTRTGALGYNDSRIYMTAVDTGWVTDERPFSQAAYEADKGFVLPLDCVDGAARILHPVLEGVSNTAEPHYAVFLKNYAPYPW